MIGDATLSGPELLCFEYEADGFTVRPTDLAGERPRELVERGYDLVFPTTVVPLGELRRHCQAWRTSPEPRRLGVLPFVVPSVGSRLSPRDSVKLREYFGVQRIYALLPSESLWSKPFAEWQQADWMHPENLSALWDLEKNVVLWAKGTGTLDWIRKHGVSVEKFFQTATRDAGPGAEREEEDEP
jgi:hypothetical protein